MFEEVVAVVEVDEVPVVMVVGVVVGLEKVDVFKVVPGEVVFLLLAFSVSKLLVEDSLIFNDPELDPLVEVL